MDIFAYTHGTGASVELGNLADSIWVQGFKVSETRSIQVSKPLNAAAPNIFDRFLVLQDFQFAAGRSFGSPASPGVAAALQFLGTHPATVPHVADLQFKAQGGEIWLNYCGITKVELAEKKGALVIFSYAVTGGAWALKRL